MECLVDLMKLKEMKVCNLNNYIFKESKFEKYKNLLLIIYINYFYINLFFFIFFFFLNV